MSSPSACEKAAFAAKLDTAANLEMSVKRAINQYIRHHASPNMLLPRVGMTIAEIAFMQVCLHAASPGA